MSVIIRLQNLPWDANALNIRQFFYGLSIPDGGVHIIGGDKGDAFIAFSTDEDARQAMRNDGLFINNTPIRLYLSSKTEMQNVISAARGSAPAPAMPAMKEPMSFDRPAQQMAPGSNSSGGNFGFPGSGMAVNVMMGEAGNQLGTPSGARFGYGTDFRGEPASLLGHPQNLNVKPSMMDQRPPLLGGIGNLPPGGMPPGGREQTDRAFGNKDVKSLMDFRKPPGRFNDRVDPPSGGGMRPPFNEIAGANQTPKGGSWGGPAGPHNASFSGRQEEFMDSFGNRPTPFDHTRSGNSDLPQGRNFATPESGNEFGKGNFSRDVDRGRPDFNQDMRNIPDRPSIGRLEGNINFENGRERMDVGRDFPRPGDDRRDFNRLDDRRNFPRQEMAASDFHRPEMERDFMRPAVGDRGFPKQEINKDFMRDDFGRDRHADPAEMNFLRGGPARAMDTVFPRNVPEPNAFRDQRFDSPVDPNVKFGGPNFQGPPFNQPPGISMATGDRWCGDAGIDQNDRFNSSNRRNSSPPRDFRQSTFPSFSGPRPSEEWLGIRDQRPSVGDQPRSLCVRVNNLPLTFNYREVRRFFHCSEIPGDGLKLINDRSGKRSGQAFIRFSTHNHLMTALRNDGRITDGCKLSIEVCSEADYDQAVDNYQPPRGRERERSRSPIRRRVPSSDRKIDLCVVIKKLPEKTDKSDLRKFMGNPRIASSGGPYIELGKDGRPIGNALVEFERRRDFDDAIKLHKKVLSGSVIDVIGISKREFDERVQHCVKDSKSSNSTPAEKNDSRSSRGEGKSKDADKSSSSQGDSKRSELSDRKYLCVEVTGLSWPTTEETLKEFFKGVEIAPNGIHLVLNNEGKAVGMAYVEFATSADCSKALARNKQFLGKRYLEIKPISKTHMMDEFKRQQRLHGGSSSKAADVVKEEVTVFMKNLNYRTQLEDILEFFHGFHPIADSIKLQYKDDRPTGDGLVVFPSKKEADGAIKAFGRKSLLGRPIELGLWSKN